MSSTAIPPIHRAIGFYAAPIGKKAVMAATGVVLFGYVLGHLAGNLQIYASDPTRINKYAAFLHNPANTVPLWAIRAFLIFCVGLHIVAATQLWLQNRAARPVSYHRVDAVASNYATRTMIWSGPIVGAFILFHILHLTVGAVVPLQDVNGDPTLPDVRHNVIAGFQNPAIAGFYILAVALLCLHLYHGVWSLCQSLGISHPRCTPWLKRLSAAVAVLIALGNISIPVSVMLGWLTF